ncbi:peroxisome assembly protein 12-like [Diaphorina citri]|uniref:Peroxisome assembly protein 12-like n=1 Tax=Diaphorina citri TaxID=121845 RepID=A0A3Q0J667_DIACI|nr:peroxisome assembly protein 12-like [Diaphorina citri]
MLSLVCLTLIPHVRNKLDDYLQTQSETSQLTKLFRSALFLSSLSRLVHHLLYLTNRIESHSPLLTLCGVRLTYVQDEHVNTNRFLSALSSLVQVGALSVQLLQTWYSNSGDDVTLTGNGVALGIPPPPGAPLSLPGSGCPLCRGRCEIPTVLATSG